MTATSLRQHRAQVVKQLALECGFSFCGISEAAFLEEEAPRLEQWLRNNMHGRMSYMERHFDKRLDPRLLVPGVRSVVSLLYNYFPAESTEKTGLRISKYAQGEDYHRVVKDKLHELVQRINEDIGEVHGRAFVDSAPVLEKAWAARSGLGWVGKNANLITKGHGSYFFIAELLLDLDLAPDGPATDHCGTCTACLDACPTGAIVQPYVVDGSRCISYFTIELRDEIPAEFQSAWSDWIFGCDVCQEVCPWNRFSKPHREPRFNSTDNRNNYTEADWLEMTEDVFQKTFGNTPLMRPGLKGLKRNVRHVSKEAK